MDSPAHVVQYAPNPADIAPLVAETVVREMEGRDHRQRHRDGQRQGDRSSTIDREPAREAPTLRVCGGSRRLPWRNDHHAATTRPQTDTRITTSMTIATT